jgi:acyl dehydratase
MRFQSITDLLSVPGQPLGTTNWVNITQEDINQFARLTRAPEWIHTDVERAQRESPFGTTVAHGYLTLSLATHFLTQLLEVSGPIVGVNYGLNRVRFPAPTPVDSRARARGALIDTTAEGDGARIVVELVYEVEGADKPPCVAEIVSLVLPNLPAVIDQ